MTTIQNKFKNVNQVWLLKELFYETATNKDNVLFTLKLEDHLGYPSLYRLYLESRDPTEYRFATENLGGWQHWELLQNCNWFKPYVEKWRYEAEIRDRSEALAKIAEAGAGNSRESFQANKYIAEGWGQKGTRGRPSKAEIAKKTAEVLSYDNDVKADFLRVVNKD